MKEDSEKQIKIDVLQSGADQGLESSKSGESQIVLKRRGEWPMSEPYPLEY